MRWPFCCENADAAELSPTLCRYLGSSMLTERVLAAGQRRQQTKARASGAEMRWYMSCIQFWSHACDEDDGRYHSLDTIRYLLLHMCEVENVECAMCTLCVGHSGVI
jgi:hypothetical protein